MHHFDSRDVELNENYLERWARKKILLFSKKRDFLKIARLAIVIEYLVLALAQEAQDVLAENEVGIYDLWRDTQYLLSSLRTDENSCRARDLDEQLVKNLGYVWDYLEINNICKVESASSAWVTLNEKRLIPESWPHDLVIKGPWRM